MSHRSLEDLLAVGREPGRAAAELADRAKRLPGRAAGVHELARRAAGLAGDLRALQPVVPHERPRGRGPGRAEAPLAASPSTASTASASARPSTSCPCTPGRLRHRRRHPLRARREPVQPRRPRSGDRTGSRTTPRRADTTSQLELDLRTALRTDGARQVYRFQLQGPNAMKIDRAGARQAPPDLKFFNMTTLDDRGQDASARCATAWSASPAGSSSARGTTARRCARRSSTPARSSASGTVGRPRLLVEHARVGLDPLAASRRVLRRQHEGVPRVAARDRLRGLGVARRQLRLRRHRGLLPHAVGPRLRPLRQVRPRLRRPRGARAAWPTATTARRSRSRSTTRT